MTERLDAAGCVVCLASGVATSKAITCIQIVKRRHTHTLHQLTALAYRRVYEYWEPKMQGLDTLKVTREVPSVVILLSKAPLDPALPGYQAPGSLGEDFRRREERRGGRGNRRGGRRGGGGGGVPGFRFAHEVQQPSVGNYFGHSSQGKAGRTEGRYYVFLPDGRLMTVSYYADNTGYHPSISYSDVKDANDLSAKDILKRRGGTTSANSRTTSGASETSSTTSLSATKDSNQDILQSEGSTTPGSPDTADFNQDILRRGGGTTLGNPRTTSGSSDTTPVRSDTTPTTSRGATKDSSQGILQGRGSTTFRNSGTTPLTSSTTFGTSLDIQKDSTQDILQRRGSTTFRNTGTTSRTSGTTPTTSLGTVKDSRAEILRRNEARRYSILQKSPRVSLTSGSRQQDLPRQGILQTEGDTSLRNPVVSPTVPLTTQRTPETPPKDTEPRRGRLLARNPGNEKREGNGGVLQGEARPLSTAPRDRLGAATVEAPSLLAKVLANGNQAQSPPANRVTRTLRPEVYISGDSDNALPVSSWAAKGDTSLLSQSLAYDLSQPMRNELRLLLRVRPIRVKIRPRDDQTRL
ncbi:hypothetical protein O3P69_019483 [Scylla paramamosain]|uniref:DNA/RNA-binding protein Alba-like domain-containing protein n=1 Tax=Scylla paramamosain TaxID=85552 RepID=A0AAW0SX96_SCYPA